jgi:hypothetical protein
MGGNFSGLESATVSEVPEGKVKRPRADGRYLMVDVLKSDVVLSIAKDPCFVGGVSSPKFTEWF